MFKGTLIFFAALAVIFSQACAKHHTPDTRMLAVNIMFGLNIPAAKEKKVTPKEFSDFIRNDVLYSGGLEGFTLTDGTGYWRDDATHKIISESSKIMTLYITETKGNLYKVKKIAESYRRRFHQNAVLVSYYTKTKVCFSREKDDCASN